MVLSRTGEGARKRWEHRGQGVGTRRSKSGVVRNGDGLHDGDGHGGVTLGATMTTAGGEGSGLTRRVIRFKVFVGVRL